LLKAIAFNKIREEGDMLLVIIDETTYREDRLIMDVIEKEITEGIYSMHPISMQYQYLAQINAELASVIAFITAAIIATNIYYQH